MKGERGRRFSHHDRGITVPKVKSDLPERTFAFAVRVTKLCQSLGRVRGVPRSLVSQLFSSGTSVGANVEEGQASQSRADFASKYSIACKEARETHYWLRLLVAADLLPEAKLAPLLQEANELIAILTSIVIKVKQKKQE